MYSPNARLNKAYLTIFCNAWKCLIAKCVHLSNKVSVGSSFETRFKKREKALSIMVVDL